MCEYVSGRIDRFTGWLITFEPVHWARRTQCSVPMWGPNSHWSIVLLMWKRERLKEQDGLILVALPLVVEGGSSGLHVLDIWRGQQGFTKGAWSFCRHYIIFTLYLIKLSRRDWDLSRLLFNKHTPEVFSCDRWKNLYFPDYFPPSLPLIIVFLSLLNMLLWHHNRQCRQGKQHRGAHDTVWSKK